MRHTNALRTLTAAPAPRASSRPTLVAFPAGRAAAGERTQAPDSAARIIDRIDAAEEAASTRAALASEELALALAEQRTAIAVGSYRSVVSWPALVAPLAAIAALPTASLRLSGVVAIAFSLWIAPASSPRGERAKKGGLRDHA